VVPAPLRDPNGGRLAAAFGCGLRPVLWSAWGRDWIAAATPASVLAAVRLDLRGGGTVLLHDSDLTAAPGCWRSAHGALPDLIRGYRAAGWTAGRMAEHGSGASHPSRSAIRRRRRGTRPAAGDADDPGMPGWR